MASSLAAATVKDFGAVGDGSADDTAAIQAAIDATPSGSTLTFPAGTYRVTSSVVFRSNKTYQGQAGATIHTNSQDFAATTEYDAAANVVIDGLTFDGGGLTIAGSANPGNNVHITHCTFQNISFSNGNWPAESGIFVAAGLTGGSTIAYNRFTHIYEPNAMEDVENDHAGGGIAFYNIAQTSITDNTFDTLYQGISGQFDNGGTFSGVVIARNNFNQVHRMGIEIQGAGTQGMLVEANTLNNFHNPYYGTCAMSIVPDGGQQTIVRNNQLMALPVATAATSQGVHYGIGLEVSGTNTTVTGNTVGAAWGYGSILIGAAPYITVQNNTICAGGAAPAVDFEAGPQPGPITSPNNIAGSCPTQQASSTDTVSPTVSITSPGNGSTVSGSVALTANAKDNVGVASVTFAVDGSNLPNSVTAAPYTVQLNTATLSNGSHTITAVARDAAGNTGTSAPVTVSVANTTSPAPASGVSVSVPANGLKMWLRADKGVTASAGKVSRWADQSGTGTDGSQPAAGAQPTLVANAGNGKPAIRFNGQSSFLGFNLPISGLNGMTIVLVGSNSKDETPGDSGSQSAAIFWGESAWWGVTYLSPFQSQVAFRFGTTQVGNLPDFTRPSSIGAAYSISTAIKNGTTDTLYVNGQQVLSASGKLGTIAASTNSGFIGRGDFDTYFAGDISEILVYNRALTAAERQSVEAYLASK